MRTRLLISLSALLLAILVSGCQALAIPLVLGISNTQSTPPIPTFTTSTDYANVPQSRTDDGAFILGNPDAPITVIAFEDFLCPHCQKYEDTTLSRFIQEQVIPGHARFEYRFLPVIDATYSFLVANLTECADTLQPGSFWKAHDVMFAINREMRFGPDTAKIFAASMGLDEKALLDCAATGKHQIAIDSAYGDALGVMGTPTVFVRYGNGQPELQTPTPFYDELAALVAKAGNPAKS